MLADGERYARENGCAEITNLEINTDKSPAVPLAAAQNLPLMVNGDCGALGL
jgi:hypothetical protein